MKDEKVVFILGAGASHTYGYPLGNELRYSIIKNYPGALNTLNKSFVYRQPNFISESIKFIEKFAGSPDLSIDLFLSKFPEFAFEGKMAIMYSILQAETSSVFLEELQDRIKYLERERGVEIKKDDWMWHLYDKLTRKFNSVESISEISFDNISFVTFNYDRSLEHFFYTSLENGFNYERIGGNPKELFDKISIEHVYGKVIELPWERKEGNLALDYRKFNPDTTPISEWVKNIKIINEDRKKTSESISQKISNANTIYFLGFGYDIANLKFLGLPDILNTNQIIIGTAYGWFDEEIEHIIQYLQQTHMYHRPLISDTGCKELLRRFYFNE